MTVIKKLKYFCFLLLVSGSIAAQDTIDVRTLKAGQCKRFGKAAMEQGDYYAAADYFLQGTKLKPQNATMSFLLAESYRQARDYAHAQEWYEKTTKLDPENAKAYYYNGQMLKMTGSCDKAKEQFLKFKKKAKGGDKEISDMKKQAKFEIAGCDSVIPFMKMVANTNIQHLDTSINKVHVDHSPVYIDTNTMLYSSVRTNKKVYTVTTQTDTVVGIYKKFYTAKKQNGKWVYNGEYDQQFNKDGFNNTNGVFSVDGKRFYFSRCKKNWKNQMICALYVSNKENGTWSEPVMLDEKINNPKYTSTMPATSIESVKQNEVVYFVSNRPGGRGGMDIWYFIYDLKKKTYSEPKNAGSKINTAADELTPYYDQDHRNLYFSSAGWPGMGGLDVFHASGEMKRFLQPENVGAPINSGSDDLYFVESANKEDGFFVSNRKGGVATKGNPTCCDDIYSFKHLEYVRINLEGTVVDEQGKPVPNSKVSLYAKNPEGGDPIFIKDVQTDEKGNYSMRVMAGKDYKLVFEKEKYLNSAHDLTTKEITSSRDLKQDGVMKEISDKAYVLTDVHYNTDKYDLLEPSQKAIDTTLLRFLNDNPDVIIEISSHTDNQASDSYNDKLSQRRADGVVKYLISKGIAAERLKPVGYGERKPVQDNNTPEGRAANRRTEFKILGKLPPKEKEYDDKEK